MKRPNLYKYSIYTLTLLFLALSLVNCAKRGRLTGGAKDTIPPVFLKAEPPNFTTNFDGDQIKIYFDEFIKLKDYQKQLIISPPLKNSFVSPQGSASKYITIDIKDTLEANTTYVFNFGQSVVDNNEGNPYSYFKYIFSTGDYIDSLTVSGSIKDALSRKPDNFVSVMLYKADSTYNDSLVYKEPPLYVTNTLDSLTTFEIGNLKEGVYKLIALKDEDANFTFQPKKDKIGFINEFITVPSDTSYALELFKEEALLKVSRPRHASAERINFGFSGNGDSLKVKLLSEVGSMKTLISKKPKQDTLNYWYKPKPEMDSLVFEVSGPNYRDTLVTKLRNLKADSLFFSSKSGSTLVLNKDFEINSSIPITKIDTSLIRVIADSTNIPFNAVLHPEKSLLSLTFNTKETTKYTINMLPNALEDFVGSKNDSLKFTTKTREFSDYGDIEFTLQNAKNFPYIVQLCDDKEKVLETRYTTSETQFNFNTLKPGKYLIRLIEDANENKLYDTGNFLAQRQAERLIYYPKTIEVNAGWLPKETFRLED